MMHLSSDGGGGFILYDDPVLDFEGGLILYGIGVVSLLLLLWSAAQNPQAFAVSLFCLFVGLFLRFFFVGDGTLYFLGCLSLPFFTYFIVSSAYALVSNAGQYGLLVWAVCAFYILGAGLLLYGSLFGEEHESIVVFFALMIGALAWFGSIVQNGETPTAHGVLYYTMRVVTIAALVWMVWNLVMFLRSVFTGGWHGRVTAVNLGMAAAGFVPLVLARVMGGMSSSRGWQILTALAVLLVYGAIAAVGVKLARVKVKGIRGGADAVLAPVILCLIHYFADSAYMNVASQTVDAALDAVNGLPTAGVMISCAEAMIEAFRNLFGGIASGVVSLVLKIFDQGARHISVGPTLTVLLMFVLLAAAISFIPDLFGRKAR